MFFITHFSYSWEKIQKTTAILHHIIVIVVEVTIGGTHSISLWNDNCSVSYSCAYSCAALHNLKHDCSPTTSA